MIRLIGNKKGAKAILEVSNKDRIKSANSKKRPLLFF